MIFESSVSSMEERMLMFAICLEIAIPGSTYAGVGVGVFVGVGVGV